MFGSFQNISELQFGGRNIPYSSPPSQSHIDPLTLASLHWMHQNPNPPPSVPYSPGISYGGWWGGPPPLQLPASATPGHLSNMPPSAELDSPVDSNVMLSSLVLADPKKVSRALNLVSAKSDATKYTCKFLFYFLDEKKERQTDPRKTEYRFARDLARCVIGPRGENVRRIFQANGGTDVTKLRLRGRGSGHKDCESQGMFFEADHETLQLCVSVRGESAYYIFTKVCAEIYDMMKVIIPDYNKDVFPGDPLAAFEISDQRVHLPAGSSREAKKVGGNVWRPRCEPPPALSMLNPFQTNVGVSPLTRNLTDFTKPKPSATICPPLFPVKNPNFSFLQNMTEYGGVSGEVERNNLPPPCLTSADPQGFLRPAPLSSKTLKLSTFVPDTTPSPPFEEVSPLSPEDEMMAGIRATSEPPFPTYSGESLMMSSPMWPSPGLNIASSGLMSIPNTPSPHTQIDLLRSMERAQFQGEPFEPSHADTFNFESSNDHFSTALAATCSSERVTPPS